VEPNRPRWETTSSALGIQALRKRVVDQKTRHQKQLLIVRLAALRVGPVALQCAQIVGVAEFMAQFFEDGPVAVRTRAAESAFHVAAKIGNDEVARAIGPAMQEALLRACVAAAASRGARCGSDARCQRLEGRLQARHHIGFSADHQAVAPVLAGNAAAGADIDVMDSCRGQVPGAPDVVTIVRIATVDHDAAGRQVRHQIGACLVDSTSRHHQPDRPRTGHPGAQFGNRRCGIGTVNLQAGRQPRLPVMHHTLLAAPQQASNHARPRS
jgi:hypothetical protein